MVDLWNQGNKGRDDKDVTLRLMVPLGIPKAAISTSSMHCRKDLLSKRDAFLV